jgi:hypothetical protein
VKGIDDAELLRILADDSGLDEALLRQKRPTKPGAIKDMRDQVEELMIPGLMQGGLSAPEARVEATRVLSWFEIAVYERGRERGLKQAADEGEI